MTGFAKFLVGAAGTSLLAWGAHAMGGADYIGGIEENAQSAFGGLGLTGDGGVAMQSDPLARIAVVSGDYDEAARATIREKLLAVPGVSGVRFAADGDGSGDANADGAAPSAEAVATCQEGVNAIVAEKEINFKSGSAYMPDSSQAVVKEVAEALKPCDGVALTVGGHTDATGSDEVNLKLSQARADTVKAALVENGLSADVITATGFGSSQPKVEGDGANAANRRIEFSLGADGAETAASEGGE